MVTASVGNDAKGVQDVKSKNVESRTLKKKTDAGKNANKGKKGGDPGRQYPKNQNCPRRKGEPLQEAQRARKAALNKGDKKSKNKETQSIAVMPPQSSRVAQIKS